MSKSSSYQKYFFPLLSRIDAETTHERTLSALALAQKSAVGRQILGWIAGNVPLQEVNLFGLTFPNILGVAAGFDKDILVTPGLAYLGFGHIEIGTITPEPQLGNPRPRIFRLKEDEALINRMGFPSAGLEVAATRLRRLARQAHNYIIGVSIGKQKDTALANAVDDYTKVLQATYPYGDYFAVNISSPNTPELRQLQGKQYLTDLLQNLMDSSHSLAEENDSQRQPLLVKIAPDLSWAELDDILQTIADQGIDGIIATNTTTSRPKLSSRYHSERGGLSGAPLADKSTEIIHYIARQTGNKLPIIGVGGIQSADDVKRKIDAGASLVQLYTGLIYQGPGIAGRILRDLKK